MRTTRRWWLRALSAAAAVVVVLLGAAPAAASARSDEWWFTNLSLAKAWTVSRGAGVTVAVVDSGVLDTLADLRGQVLPGADLSGMHTDGRADAGEGCDTPGGCFSHGTNIALLVAGTGRGIGFTGVAPAAKILPVKVETRSGSTGDQLLPRIAQGIRWAVDHGAQIVNVSLGAQGACEPDLAAAAKYAYQHDVLVVAAAGNEGSAVSEPANCPGVLAVGATDRSFRPWAHSNAGPQVAFTGAGVDTIQESNTAQELVHADGTSPAAAVVSGTLALIRSHAPAMSARDVVTHALNNVHNGTGHFGVRIDDQRGYGEILPYYAMTYQLPASAPNPVFDAWERQLGPPRSPTASQSATAGAASSPAPASSDDARSPGSSPDPLAAGRSSGSAASGGSPTGVIVGVAAAVLVAGAAVALVLRSRRGSRT